MKVKILLFMATILALTSCSKEDTKSARPPIFQGFSIMRGTEDHLSIVNPGDVITITAEQSANGRHIYGAHHKWTLVLPGETEARLSYETSNGRVESSTDNPTWKVTIPDDAQVGTCRVQFSASWGNASDGITGTYRGTTGPGCLGQITSTCSTLYSKATGQFTFRIQNKQ